MRVAGRAFDRARRPTRADEAEALSLARSLPPSRYVANVGDSRAVLGRVDEKTGRVVATNLSHDHKPDSERERKRIEGGGGYVAPWQGGDEDI